ncbi:serine/threonine-protein kinase STY8-like isoform X2 [Panicum virgatum]|uniref:serine/threonine-protein kinase STY8-like isoform X2 n=1 Tax=Panicum virgatum TaxID=38727 RepID=UPI0019D594C3|nr:serine/threonine-protein kinase STY8-like isoform X2 [Panicum virgatum]
MGYHDIAESSWTSAAAANRGGSSGGGYTDILKEIFDRLMAKGIEEVVSDPSAFREQLHRHFERLPARSASCHLYLLCSLSSHLHASLLGTVDFHFSAISSYSIDLDVEKPEDVLLHRRILDECANNPDKRPVFHVRFLRCIRAPLDSEDSGGSLTSTLRRDIEIRPIHEIIFSTIDKTKLLRELSDLMSEVGLNIHEAHVFSTTDGFCLDVFVVDGWDTKETDGLLQGLKETAARSHASLIEPNKFCSHGKKY